MNQFTFGLVVPYGITNLLKIASRMACRPFGVKTLAELILSSGESTKFVIKQTRFKTLFAKYQPQCVKTFADAPKAWFCLFKYQMHSDPFVILFFFGKQFLLMYQMWVPDNVPTVTNTKFPKIVSFTGNMAMLVLVCGIIMNLCLSKKQIGEYISCVGGTLICQSRTT